MTRTEVAKATVRALRGKIEIAGFQTRDEVRIAEELSDDSIIFIKTGEIHRDVIIGDYCISIFRGIQDKHQIIPTESMTVDGLANQIADLVAVSYQKLD